MRFLWISLPVSRFLRRTPHRIEWELMRHKNEKTFDSKTSFESHKACKVIPFLSIQVVELTQHQIKIISDHQKYFLHWDSFPNSCQVWWFWSNHLVVQLCSLVIESRYFSVGDLSILLCYVFLRMHLGPTWLGQFLCQLYMGFWRASSNLPIREMPHSSRCRLRHGISGKMT